MRWRGRAGRAGASASSSAAASLGASSAGMGNGLVGLVEGLAVGPPEFDLGWGADDAFGDIDRLGRADGGGAQGAGLLLHVGRHRGLQHRELDGPAALDEERLAGVELADLVGVDPGPVGHVHAGLAGWPPGIQLPGLLGHPDGAGELHQAVGVGGLVQDQPAADGVEQPPLLALVAEAFGGLGAEDDRDADIAEAFGEVDGLVGAALDGRELIQDQQHVIARPGPCGGWRSGRGLPGPGGRRRRRRCGWRWSGW